MILEMGMGPNEVTLISILSACTETGAFLEGGYIHGMAVKTGIIKLVETMHGYILCDGLDENIAITTPMLSLYSKLGKLDASKMLFDGIKDPDRIAWTAMIDGLKGIGDLAKKMVATNMHVAFSLVYKLVMLTLVLPVATASMDRAFTTMKIVKSRLCDLMGDQWLNDSLVVFTERKTYIFSSISYDAIMDRF
ncbi:hypothetical protein RD792_005880 [Penstemon davidsonii]|uniref:HAT C-terminal dimerisation domain-containing protein n=1 Tax=Penstemon davidsonii TaxID=160366 RepID=A0ABR0DF49_9LAMI|nr:hypothetical protein RD792_005880 [Penstemon davidsonii]